MLIETKFYVGERVWVVKEIWDRVPCSCCSQTGTIIGDDRKKYSCPGCGGTGHFRYFSHGPERATIEAIGYNSLMEPGTEVVYRLSPGGDRHRGIYATEAEAQEACDRKNAELAEQRAKDKRENDELAEQREKGE